MKLFFLAQQNNSHYHVLILRQKDNESDRERTGLIQIFESYHPFKLFNQSSNHLTEITYNLIQYCKVLFKEIKHISTNHPLNEDQVGLKISQLQIAKTQRKETKEPQPYIITMLNTQGSEVSESLQELKNFQVFIRVKPQSKEESLSLKRPADKFKSNQQQQQPQFSQQFQQSFTSGFSQSPFNTMIQNNQSNQFQQNQFSSSSQSTTSIKVDEELGLVIINDPEFRTVEGKEKIYSFDGVLSESSSNVDTFQKSVLPSLSGIIEGYNATVFAYGITGSGKTHTIFGGNGGVNRQNGQEEGVSYMAVEYLLNNLEMRRTTIKFSFLEIYNETVRDLLNPSFSTKNLTIVEDPVTKNITVMELKEFVITDIMQIKELIDEGNDRRALAATSGNQFSSRSHAIIIIQIEQRQLNSATHIEELISSKLTIIDLAGSERSDKVGQHNKGVQEGSNINKSLLALGNCINILSEKRSKQTHVPYRDSKLTRILKDSLGGNTKSVMIGCVSQNMNCIDETLNTLNYASRATNIKKRVSKNIVQEIDQLQQKQIIQQLQNELAYYKNRSVLQTDTKEWNSSIILGNSYMTSDKIKEEQKKIKVEISELQDKLGDTRIGQEQNGNQEEFVERICSDLFQNVEESHQLLTSMQEIEELLVQDYQKLRYYQNHASNNSIGILEQISDSIRENEDIKQKMKTVLATNQEQKQNLKYLLLKVSNKKQIQIEYDLKARKQQLEMLDLLENKFELEKQLQLLSQENNQLKKCSQQQQYPQQQQIDPSYQVRTQTCPDEPSKYSSSFRGHSASPLAGQAFSQQLLQYEQINKSLCQRPVEEKKQSFLQMPQQQPTFCVTSPSLQKQKYAFQPQLNASNSSQSTHSKSVLSSGRLASENSSGIGQTLVYQPANLGQQQQSLPSGVPLTFGSYNGNSQFNSSSQPNTKGGSLSYQTQNIFYPQTANRSIPPSQPSSLLPEGEKENKQYLQSLAKSQQSNQPVTQLLQIPNNGIQTDSIQLMNQAIPHQQATQKKSKQASNEMANNQGFSEQSSTLHQLDFNPTPSQKNTIQSQSSPPLISNLQQSFTAYSQNINQSTALSLPKPKREPQSTVIDLFQTSFQPITPTSSSSQENQNQFSGIVQSSFKAREPSLSKSGRYDESGYQQKPLNIVPQNESHQHQKISCEEVNSIIQKAFKGGWENIEKGLETPQTNSSKQQDSILNLKSQKLLNYGNQLEEDCIPKLDSSSEIADSAAKLNPLETEESDSAQSSSKASFVNSPQIFKNSRTLGVQNPNMYKKSKNAFDLLE